MTDAHALGPWLRRFLEEYLVSERNLARNTQLSYRDTLVLLLRFAAAQARTRNQRLAAIRCFARYVAGRCPEHVAWCNQVRAIPLKKTAPPPVGYLEKHEIDALLDAPDTSTPQGRRERALLLFLYHTGARASEAAQLTVRSLQLAGNGPGHSLVTLQGKGGKTRLCPLLPASARALAPLVQGRAAGEAVFLSRLRRPITRSGIRQLVIRCAAKAAQQSPSLVAKKVGPHLLRHTAATHLLRSGVDLNTIRAWLGLPYAHK